MEIKHIVHPTDFSPTAKDAFEVAVQLAKKSKASLKVVHVFETPYPTSYFAGPNSQQARDKFTEELEGNLQHRMDELVKSVNTHGITVETELIGDMKPWKLHEKYGDDEMDFIVMGTRGRTGILHGGLLGTTAQRTMRYSTVPVLTVPEIAKAKDYNNIIFATDFADPEEVMVELPPVLEFAQLYDSTVHVTVVNSAYAIIPKKEIEAAYKSVKAKYSDHKLELKIVDGDTVPRGIFNAANDLDADMIAIETDGSTGLLGWFIGSVTEELAAETNIPLLVIPLPDKIRKRKKKKK